MLQEVYEKCLWDASQLSLERIPTKQLNYCSHAVGIWETRVENFRVSIEMVVFEQLQRKTNGPNYA
jgi:hypothetical protein